MGNIEKELEETPVARVDMHMEVGILDVQTDQGIISIDSCPEQPPGRYPAVLSSN